jgi:hypothetical protein
MWIPIIIIGSCCIQEMSLLTHNFYCVVAMYGVDMYFCVMMNVLLLQTPYNM